MTAERVAMRRAAHQLRDTPPVFEDPLALTILRPDVAAWLREEAQQPERSPLSRYFRAFSAVRSRFAEVGEPWKTFFDPADLASELLAAGFGRVVDLDSAALNARYFASRQDGLTLAGSVHIAKATV